MRYSYLDFFRNLYRRQGQRYAFSAHTQKEFFQWKEEFRGCLWDVLGLNTLNAIRAEAELNIGFSGQAKLVETIREEGYFRRKYVLETLPEVYMPFYMLIPDGIKEGEKHPAAIAIPAHGANKDTVAGFPSCPEAAWKLEQMPKEAYGKALVQKGYIVFCPDPPGYGERLEPCPGEEMAAVPELKANPLGSSCKNLALTAEALGLSFQGLEIWDLMRLADFASTSGMVDEKRFGCVGFSGGGQYAMWLSAMDDRISRVAVSGYVHSYYESILDTHLCPCNYAPGLWLLGDISDVCALIAPRPLYVENGIKDVENGPRGILGPKEQVEKIRKAYNLFGQGDLLIHGIFEEGHMWYGGCLENGFF